MIEVMPEANNPPKKSRRMLFLSFFFIIVLAVIIYSSFFADLSITGDITNEVENFQGIPLNANLYSVPNISVKGEFSSISIKGLENSLLFIGNQKFPMNDSNRLFINNYNGEISFDGIMIKKLKGYASSVSLNGLPILPGSDKDIKVYIESPMEYSYLGISDQVFLRKIDYTTSGKIIYGEENSIINLEEDPLLIKDFLGNVKVDGGELFLEGSFEKLEINGNQGISIG